MNILHLSPYVPDVRASHAGGVHMGKTVETLKKQHRVTVLTFCNNAEEEKLLKDHPDFHAVRTSRVEFVRKVLLHPLMPNMFALRRDQRFEKELYRLIETEKIQAVHAEYTAMGQYAEKIRRRYPEIRFHLVEHDVAVQSYERKEADAAGLSRIYYRMERKKAEKTERKYVQAADQVFTLNGKDQALLREKYGISGAKVLHPYYGLDLDGEPETKPEGKTICFVGQMGRQENHEAAIRLIRIFRAVNPEGWKLTVIGAHPRPELAAEESDTVHITGFVEDINAEIRKARIAVFPLIHGAGIKLKVLLAFGLGLPVITGAVGAEGIDPEGKVIRLAETDSDYEREIRALTEDELLREQLGRESRAYVREHFSWTATEEVFREVYGDGEADRKGSMDGTAEE